MQSNHMGLNEGELLEGDMTSGEASFDRYYDAVGRFFLNNLRREAADLVQVRSRLPELLLVEYGIDVRKRTIEALALDPDGFAELESEA